MPCNCDYMEPSRHEEESRRTAEVLVYALSETGRNVDNWIVDAANNYYGDKQGLNTMVQMLCAICTEMTDEQKAKIIYDGRNEKARKLADWWDEHQKADQARIELEKIEKKIEQIREKALSKLTDDEKKALGLWAHH